MPLSITDGRTPRELTVRVWANWSTAEDRFPGKLKEVLEGGCLQPARPRPQLLCRRRDRLVEPVGPPCRDETNRKNVLARLPDDPSCAAPADDRSKGITDRESSQREFCNSIPSRADRRDRKGPIGDISASRIRFGIWGFQDFRVRIPFDRHGAANRRQDMLDQ